VVGFQTLIDPLGDAEASRLPSRAQTIDLTDSACPSGFGALWLVASSQILTVPSWDAEASRFFFCDQATEVTASVCPGRDGSHWLVAAFQILIVLSDAKANLGPSCEQIIEEYE